MSVLIKGMEMPGCCGSCPCFHAENPIYCQAVKADRSKRIAAPYGLPRPDWCPLIEVPEDVQPVKHGEWMPSEDNSKVFGCSKCHEIVYGTPNYCPRCGARMDGEA